MMDQSGLLKKKKKTILPRKKKTILQTKTFLMFAPSKNEFSIQKNYYTYPQKSQFSKLKKCLLQNSRFSKQKKLFYLFEKLNFQNDQNLYTRIFFFESALFQVCFGYGTAIFMLGRLGRVFNKPIRVLLCARFI